MGDFSTIEIDTTERDRIAREIEALQARGHAACLDAFAEFVATAFPTVRTVQFAEYASMGRYYQVDSLLDEHGTEIVGASCNDNGHALAVYPLTSKWEELGASEFGGLPGEDYTAANGVLIRIIDPAS